MNLDRNVIKAVQILRLIELENWDNAEGIAGCMHEMTPRSVTILCNRMVKEGILASKRGPKGGYSIARTVTLADLVGLFDKNYMREVSVPVIGIAEKIKQKIHCDLLAAADSVFIV